MTENQLPHRIPDTDGADVHRVDLPSVDLLERLLTGLENLSTGAVAVVCADLGDDWDEQRLRGAADKWGVTLADTIVYRIGGKLSWADLIEAVDASGAAAVVTPDLAHLNSGEQAVTRICALITAADGLIWPRGHRWPDEAVITVRDNAIGYIRSDMTADAAADERAIREVAESLGIDLPQVLIVGSEEAQPTLQLVEGIGRTRATRVITPAREHLSDGIRAVETAGASIHEAGR